MGVALGICSMLRSRLTPLEFFFPIITCMFIEDHCCWALASRYIMLIQNSSWLFYTSTAWWLLKSHKPHTTPFALLHCLHIMQACYGFVFNVIKEWKVYKWLCGAAIQSFPSPYFRVPIPSLRLYWSEWRVRFRVRDPAYWSSDSDSETDSESWTESLGISSLIFLFSLKKAINTDKYSFYVCYIL